MRLEIELSKIESLIKIEELKTEIDKLRPLSSEIEDRIFRKFRLDWNYHSNAIEGNTLNYGETYAFLMHGVTAKGKPLKDYLDIKGHNSAINFLLNFIHDKEELTEAAIRELHKTILSEPYDVDAMTSNGKKTKKRIELGVYKRTPNHVLTSTGEMHYFASPEETPAKMNDLMKWFRDVKTNKDVHPVVIAALFHHKFASIHPFDDGNGRIARLLMNLILMQYHLPPAIIKKEDRGNYYLALSQADIGIYQPFVEYISESVVHSQGIYLKGAKGESIEEADDIDKEIVLLKKQLEARQDVYKKYNSPEVQRETLKVSFDSLLKKVNTIVSKFEGMFIETNYSYKIIFNNYPTIKKDTDNISITPIINEISHSRENKIEFVEIKVYLNKFKAVNIKFYIVLLIKLMFLDHKFFISVKVKDNDINSITNDNIAEWAKNITYDEQISEEEIEEIVKIISSGILNFIKSKTDTNND